MLYLLKAKCHKKTGAIKKLCEGVQGFSMYRWFYKVEKKIVSLMKNWESQRNKKRGVYKSKKFISLLSKAEAENCAAETFWNKVQTLLHEIPDEELIDTLGMQDMSRIIHVIRKKYRTDIKYREIDNRDLEIACADAVVGRASYQSVVIHFIKVEDNKLLIEGETSIPACFPLRDAEPWAMINNREYKTELYPRIADKTILGEVYEFCRSFTLRYALSDDVYPLEIKFFSKLNGINVEYRAIVGMRFSPIASQLKNQYARVGNYLLRIKENKIQVFVYSSHLLNEFENSYRKVLNSLNDKNAHRASRFREYYFYFQKRKQREIWIFSDRINKADDNGEAFFSYMLKRDTGIQAYFIVNGTSRDYARLALNGNVVRAKSFKHQMLHTLADYIFTSQSNGFIENPFGEGEIYYRDLQHRPKIIFLQHGVTKDNHTKHFNRFNQDFFALVTSSSREASAFLTLPYFYEKQQIWLTGMPRLDLLYHDEQKKILIIPTWRKNLMRQTWNEKLQVYTWEMTDQLRKPLYIKRYKNLLNSRKLRELAEKYSYRIIFIPHPLMYPYIAKFKVPSYIETLSFEEVCLRKVFAESNIMVTDYSSVAFDFAYLKKPVLYYQFDRDSFFTNHTYKRGYFSYERDGFGEIIDNEAELLSVMEQYLKSECHMKDMYGERVDRFFDMGKGSCSERLFTRVKFEAEV